MTSGGNTKSTIPGAVVPDGGYGWVIVFASFMIHFIMDGITYSIGELFLQPMMGRLHTGRAALGILYGMLPAITLGSGPVATILTNTYGCRRVTMIGATIAGLGFFASYFWANLWFYYLTIGIIGAIGFGLIYLPAIVSVGFYFERNRSFAMGIAVCGSGLGTLAFPVFMPYIMNNPFWFDYDGGLLFESALAFICIIFGVLMIPLPQEPSEIRRLERKSRSEVKRLALKGITTTNINDEQRNQLLPTTQQRNIPLQDFSVVPRESTAVVPAGQELLSDEKRRVSLSHLNETELNESQLPPSISARSAERVDEITETPVVLSRKDAVYQGSLHNIPLYNEDTEEYHRQMITTTETDTAIISKPKKSFLVQIGEQIDLKLLKDAAFALFAVSNFLTSLGFNVPYIYANDVASDADVVVHQRHWILMTVGISNCFGRVIIGLLGDQKWINRLMLYNVTLIIAGLAVIAAPFSNSHVGTHMAYAAFFGFFSGGYVGLTSIIVVDLVGVDKLSDAFGVLLLFQGVAVAIGPPIAGLLRDRTMSYLWPYSIFGGSILISGLILFLIPWLQRIKERRQQPTQHELDMGVRTYSKQNLSVPEQQQQL